jgi:hypothetical protein
MFDGKIEMMTFVKVAKYRFVEIYRSIERVYFGGKERKVSRDGKVRLIHIIQKGANLRKVAKGVLTGGEEYYLIEIGENSVDHDSL